MTNYPKLLPADTTPQTVDVNNGLGHMTDTISCQIEREVNGQDELLLTYPVTGRHYGDFRSRMIIYAEADSERGWQPYRIYRITKPINGIISIYARHIAYDLGGYAVTPFTADGIQSALSGMIAHALPANTCPFTLASSRTTASNFSVSVPTSMWGLMGGQTGSLLDVYGGEYFFDGWTVRLENRIGADNGVSVTYGVNMQDCTQDINCTNVYTGAIGYWQSNGQVVQSGLVAAEGTFDYVRILSVDVSDRITLSEGATSPTVAQVTAATEAYVQENQISTPTVSWTVKFIPLDTTEEYKELTVLERVSLGDTVSVHFALMGVDASARVSKIKWDVLAGRPLEVSLGSIRNNIADTIAGQAKDIAAAPTTGDVSRIAAAMARVMLGVDGGCVRALDTNADGMPDTLYVADHPDPAQATKVWRFSYLGWAASSNGYNGPFKMAATLDSGILANFITAGTLNADLITAGTLSADRIAGGTYKVGGINNASGVIRFYDGTGNQCGYMAVEDTTQKMWVYLGNNNLHTLIMDDGVTVRRSSRYSSGLYDNGLLLTENPESGGSKQCSISASGITFITINGNTYKRISMERIGFLVYGRPTSTAAYTSVFVPEGQYTGYWQISDEANFVKFSISVSGDVATVTKVGGASSGSVVSPAIPLYGFA